MSHRRKHGAKRGRGYLLMEVMVGGVLVASGLMTLTAAVADMRYRSEMASREVTAAQLMNQKLEEVRSVAYANLGGLTTYAPGAPEIITLSGTYARSFQRTFVAAVPGSSPAYYEFTVTVTYNLHHEVRDISGQTRIYDPS